MSPSLERRKPIKRVTLKVTIEAGPSDLQSIRARLNRSTISKDGGGSAALLRVTETPEITEAIEELRMLSETLKTSEKSIPTKTTKKQKKERNDGSKGFK